MKLPVIIENESGHWGAYTPTEGINVYATGESREEVVSRFQEGLLGLLHYRRDTGGDVPDITELEIYESRETLPLAGSVAA